VSFEPSLSCGRCCRSLFNFLIACRRGFAGSLSFCRISIVEPF
jgi:hypothetical protein